MTLKCPSPYPDLLGSLSGVEAPIQLDRGTASCPDSVPRPLSPM